MQINDIIFSKKKRQNSNHQQVRPVQALLRPNRYE
jgi:hypothetical protein